jgi:glucose-1-phosphate adenylyltransferase
VNSYSHVEESILLPGCSIGRNARVRRAIIERDVHVPENGIIGYDAAEDAKRYHVSESGIVVVDGTDISPRVVHMESRLRYHVG